MNIVFMGFGTIGKLIYKELLKKDRSNLSPMGIMDPALSDDEKVFYSANGLMIYDSIEDLLSYTPDIVIEAANQGVATKYVPLLLQYGIKVLSLSVGAYLKRDVMEKVNDSIKNGKTGRLIIPSGALPGVDVIKAVTLRPVHSVEIITRKPPRALQGAPGLKSIGVNIEKLESSLKIYEGTAINAVPLFPSNINIAATLSLAGIGPEKTLVTIIADPSINVNVHTLKIKGDFGCFESRMECQPSENPKTSYIAPLSAVSALYNLVDTVLIGT